MNRRQYLGTLGLAGLVAMTGSVQAARQVAPDDYHGVPTWAGAWADRPAPSEFRAANYDGEAIYIDTDHGRVGHLDLGVDDTWRTLATVLPTYMPADLPDAATVPEGMLAHDQGRGTIAWEDGSGWEFPSFVDDVKTSATVVSNTTTRTEVFNPDINVDSLIEGRDYELTISGKFSTANNSDTFDVIVDLGGTDVASLTNAGKNVTDAHFRAVTEFSVRPGSGGDVHLAPESYGRFDEQPRGAVHDVVAVDPTQATNLSVDIQWSAAAAGNSVTVERGTLQQRG